MSKLFKFKDIVINNKGFLRGPFGGDLKKEIFVEKNENTYKVYEQGVVLNSDKNIGRYYISEKDFLSKLHKFSVQDKDFLVSCSGINMGAIYQLEEPFEKGIINQALLRIRLKNEIVDDKYFYYLFKELISKKITSGSGDSTIPNFPPLEVVKNIEFHLPDLSVQQKAGKVLSDLDSKIELNNKINAELEAMAKTLYDYWFVQFDFPVKNGKPYKSSGGKMFWNEELKREIPEGWDCFLLGNLGNFKNGVNYDPSNPGDIACPIINVRNISASSYFIKNSDLDIIYLREVDVRKYSVHEGSIIIARSGIPGATRLISNMEENTLYCGFAIHYELNKLFQRIPVFFYLKSIEDMIRNGSEGTILKNVNQGVLNNLKIALPKKEDVIVKFNELITPIFNKINLIEKENQELASFRDWLLPMLMNGQVTVGNITINDIEKDEVLAMVAEPVKEIVSKKKKETKVVSIKANPVEIYKRTLLAAEIVYQLHNEATLGHLKLQKLLYLCQEVNNMSLPMNFLKQAMGPYDNRLMRSLDKQFEEKRWFKFEKTEFLKYKPLGAVGSHQNDYLKYFEGDKPKIDYLIATFRKYRSHDIEAVATLYACWKEAIGNKELVNLELILKKFYAWSEEKEKFKPEELKSHLTWMKNNGICPK